jgi:hypothetical protein
MNMEYLTWFGYTASAIIALSMTMSSIVKFRWINLVGALSFSTYGFFIDAIPVMALNGFIATVDIFYLYRIYSKKELFSTLEVRGDNKYLLKFLDFHNNEIQKFFPGFSYNPEKNTISFFVLRNMNVAGIFLAHREDGHTLKVGLDYVVPQYRDYKNGHFIYHRLRDRFLKDGFEKVVVRSNIRRHSKYLKKLGFSETGGDLFVKKLK